MTHHSEELVEQEAIEDRVCELTRQGTYACVLVVYVGCGFSVKSHWVCSVQAIS